MAYKLLLFSSNMHAPLVKVLLEFNGSFRKAFNQFVKLKLMC
jgi:hypothetical protein